ncbi:MAG: hypothetical protein PHH85_00040 [Candidatus Methanoperedens sp.]|nr:hypothetical protein [Candidatus Methanoperedens sp.]
MKKINQFLISLILIAILTNPVLGYAGMGGNSSGINVNNISQNPEEAIDLANATQSDMDIMLIQHLIEVDAAQFEAQNKIYVRETLIFKNIGEKNFSGTLRTWVPDGLEGLKVGKVPMTMGGSVIPINAIQNGNVISWNDYIKSNNPLPPLYAVEYVLSAEPKGTFSKSKFYTKKLVYPTLVNKAPLNVVLKVTRGSGETITLKDEVGSSISTSVKPLDEDNSVLYNWETPKFKEINIEISKSAIDLSQIAIYLIIGLLIVLVLSYPVIRKKSPKLMEIEEKIRTSLKREPGNEEQQEAVEDTPEEELEEEQEEPAPDEELPEKTKDELETEKSELISKLDELEKDYASGNMIDEEYEELRNSYQKKLKNINRRIERS